jgi:uncharacterized protein (UPF0332 family)
MTPEQARLLLEARRSLDAAKDLRRLGYAGFSASRAYYAMFYVAEAFLLGKGLAFSKHSGVHGGFGKHFIKTEIVPAEFLKYLRQGMEVRHAGDYGAGTKVVTEEEADTQIMHAGLFLELAERLIGSISSEDRSSGPTG